MRRQRWCITSPTKKASAQSARQADGKAIGKVLEDFRSTAEIPDGRWLSPAIIDSGHQPGTATMATGCASDHPRQERFLK